MKLQIDPSEFFKLNRRFDPKPERLEPQMRTHKTGIAFPDYEQSRNDNFQNTQFMKRSLKEKQGFVYKFIKVSKYLLQMARAAYL